jgi:uncharacterized protein (TIGR00369 family)
MKEGLFQQLKAREGQYFTESLSKGGQWLNYRIVWVEPGEVDIEVLVRPEMTNPQGMIHGGMTALICDEVCGLAFYSTGQPTFYTTINLVIDYLYSAPEGTTLLAKGYVIRHGKKIANVACDILDPQNRLIARACSNLANTDKAIFNLCDGDS